MPLVSLIGNGSIKVYMYGNDYGAPHIHVRHGDVWCKVAIGDGSMIAGDLRGRQRRLVQAWIQRLGVICWRHGNGRSAANIPAGLPSSEERWH